MKSSLYNVYRKCEHGYILFNMFTNAVAQIDEEMKYLLDKNPDKIPVSTLDLFSNNGFVVEDNCVEKKLLAYHFDKDKYNVILRDLVYTVAMTYVCNLACPYCYQGAEKDTGTMDQKRVGLLLKNIDLTLSKKNFKAFDLSLYGGEPLIAYHECIQLMEGVSKICDQQGKRFRGNIITNGVLINKEIVDTLLKPYCDSIQITFDGGREAHNKRRIRKDGGGTYDTLLYVLEILRDADINLSLRLNVDRESADTFTELSRDLEDRGLKDIEKHVGWIYPSHTERPGEGCSGYAGKCFSYAEITGSISKICEQLDIKRTSITLPVVLKHDPCTFDREDIYVVDPYLDIYNCWEFIGKKDKKVGHIDVNGEIAFNYEYYEQMSRDPLEFEECKDCKYLPFCAGGCAAQAYYENGTYHSSPCKKHKYSRRKYKDSNMEIILKEIEFSILGEET